MTLYLKCVTADQIVIWIVRSYHCNCGRVIDIGNESVPKMIIDDHKSFFLNCLQHSGNFKP